MNIKIFTLLFLASLCLLACRFNPAMQGKGTDSLQGVWIQDSIPYQQQLLEYTTHRFTFTCDSFYATLQTHSKVNRSGSAECFNNGIWNEYAKGTYLIRKDTLYLHGTFTGANFKQKLSGCYRIGQYLPVFVIKKHIENIIELEDLYKHMPVILHLKNKITCIPKPL